MQGNVLGQSGGNIGLNIFTQPNEPYKKDGIWIKTAEKKLYNKVQILNNFDYINSDYAQLEDIPSDRNNNSCATAVDTQIYIFPKSTSDKPYKYNALTNTYTQLADIPNVSMAYGAVAINTDIYLLGGGEDGINNVKYDTLTNTYTQLENIPYSNIRNGFYQGSAVVIGTDIYILGGGGDNGKNNIKYDTLANTYTRLNDLPKEFRSGSAVAVNNDIYILGGSNDKSNYKYDILTAEYTKLTDLPNYFSDGSAVAIDADIYLLGGSGFMTNYKYNPITDTYTQLENVPFDSDEGTSVAVGTDIHIVGGKNPIPYSQHYKFRTIKAIENKTIIIEVQDYGSVIALNKFLKIYPVSAKIYDDNALQDNNAYVGNGIEWRLLN